MHAESDHLAEPGTPRLPGTVGARLRFPVEVEPPADFAPADPSTWPHEPGRWEFLDGRLLYMSPCGDVQQTVTLRLAGLFDRWLDEHPEFTAGTNEAGMLLGGDVRGADAAIWRIDALGPDTGGFRRVPPVLAVEVAGRDEGERELREKASWYLGHGVVVVWIALPAERAVLVLRAGAAEQRLGKGERLPVEPALPGLTPSVDEIFARLRD